MLQDKKTILRIKIAYDKLSRKLNILRDRRRDILKIYREKDRQQKILNIKKEIMKKREPLMTEEYFDENILSTENSIKEIEIELMDSQKKFIEIEMVYYDLFIDQYELLISKYSRGVPIKELQYDFIKIIDYWESYLSCPNHEEFFFEDSLENYELALWLFSIGILLKIDNEVINRLLICIDNDGKDLLFETFKTKAKGKSVLKNTKKLVYPREYKLIYDSLNEVSINAVKHLQQFLTIWYKNMKYCYWYENHKGQDGGGFFGYWCWEAALVTYLTDMDDSAYRDMPYYPKDIVDFARSKS